MAPTSKTDPDDPFGLNKGWNFTAAAAAYQPNPDRVPQSSDAGPGDLRMTRTQDKFKREERYFIHQVRKRQAAFKVAPALSQGVRLPSINSAYEPPKEESKTILQIEAGPKPDTIAAPKDDTTTAIKSKFDPNAYGAQRHSQQVLLPSFSTLPQDPLPLVPSGKTPEHPTNAQLKPQSTTWDINKTLAMYNLSPYKPRTAKATMATQEDDRSDSE